MSHRITEEVRCQWKQEEVGYYQSSSGPRIAAGDTIRRKEGIGGSRPPFVVGSIFKNGDGVFAHMVGIRTGLYLGISGDLKDFEKVHRSDILPRPEKKAGKGKRK